MGGDESGTGPVAAGVDQLGDQAAHRGQQLLAAAGGPLRAFLRLSANTRARRGELLAIQWGDIDLDQSRIVIRRSLVPTPGTGLVLRETKTGRKGHRTIGIGANVVAELAAHGDEQRALAVEHLLPEPVWVFSPDAGVTPWRPDYITLKFNRLRRRLGLEHVRRHDLRHFVATSTLAWLHTRHREQRAGCAC